MAIWCSGDVRTSLDSRGGLSARQPRYISESLAWRQAYSHPSRQVRWLLSRLSLAVLVPPRLGYRPVRSLRLGLRHVPDAAAAVAAVIPDLDVSRHTVKLARRRRAAIRTRTNRHGGAECILPVGEKRIQVEQMTVRCVQVTTRRHGDARRRGSSAKKSSNGTALVLLANVPPIEDARAAANVCRPGDISITPTSKGYEIRRASADGESGSQWELIATIASARAAGRSARELAALAGRSTWLYFEGADLIPLPVSPADPDA